MIPDCNTRATYMLEVCVGVGGSGVSVCVCICVCVCGSSPGKRGQKGVWCGVACVPQQVECICALVGCACVETRQELSIL